MPPRPKEDRIPATLDTAKLRKLALPLQVRAVRMHGDTEGEVIPLENRTYTHEEIEQFEVTTLPRVSGGGRFLISVWSASNPEQQVQWYSFIHGPQVPPAPMRAQTAQAELDSRAAQLQAAHQMAQMPLPGQVPWPNATQAPGPVPTPALPPTWPYSWFPYGVDGTRRDREDPSAETRIRDLEAQLRQVQRAADDERHRHELETERRRQEQALAQQARDLDARLAAERAERDRQHREMLEALRATQKPAVDPQESERRLREELERRERATQQTIEQARREEKFQREMETLRADSQRQAQELQKDLAAARTANDAKALQDLSTRMLDMQRESSDKMLALVREQSEQRKRDPLEELTRLKALVGDDPLKQKLLDYAMDMMQTGSGGGPAATAEAITRTLGDSAERIVDSIANYRVAAMGGRRGANARNAFAALAGERQRQAAAAANQVSAGPRAAELGGAVATPPAASPKNGVNGVHIAPAGGGAAEASPTSNEVKEEPAAADTEDAAYFGLIWNRVQELRAAARAGRVDPGQVTDFLIDGYTLLCVRGMEAQVPALDDFEEHPEVFVARLFPGAKAEKFRAAVAHLYPPRAAEVRHRFGLDDEPAEGSPPEEPSA